MAEGFVYLSQTRIEFRHGYRHANLDEGVASIVYDVQGTLREHDQRFDGPPVAPTLDQIVAAAGD